MFVVSAIGLTCPSKPSIFASNYKLRFFNNLSRSLDSYSTKIIDHYRSPRYAGTLACASAKGVAENPACGDSMRFFARVEDGIIAEVSCQTFGCAPSVAAGSVLTELVKGKPLNSLKIDASVVEKALGGLPAIKKHAAVLAADAFQNFTRDYNTTQPTH